MNLLIVDDEYYSRKAIIKAIGTVGGTDKYAIYEAENGLNAMDIIGTNKIDMLITDIKMPEMDGIQLIEEINTQGRSIATIIISGYSEFDYAQKGIQFGVKNYLLKPIDHEELIAAITELRKCIEEGEIKKRTSNRNNRIQKIMKNIYNNELSEKISKDHILALIQSKDSIHKEDELAIEINLKEHLLEASEAESILFFENPLKSHEFILCYRGTEIGDKLTGEIIKRQLDHYFSSYRIGLCDLKQHGRSINRCYEKLKELLIQRLFSEELLFYECKCKRVPNNYDSIYKQIEEWFSEGHERNNLEKLISRMNDGIGLKKAYEYIMSTYIERNSYSPIKVRDIGSFSTQQELVSYIMDRIDGKNECHNQQKEERNVINQLIKYIDENYCYDINLNDLAIEEFYMNPSYISRIFKQKTRMSFSSYVKKVRMENAKRLSEQRDLTVTQIANLVGYNSTSYFIKVYKNYYGTTPGVK